MEEQSGGDKRQSGGRKRHLRAHIMNCSTEENEETENSVSRDILPPLRPHFPNLHRQFHRQQQIHEATGTVSFKLTSIMFAQETPQHSPANMEHKPATTGAVRPYFCLNRIASSPEPTLPHSQRLTM